MVGSIESRWVLALTSFTVGSLTTLGLGTAYLGGWGPDRPGQQAEEPPVYIRADFSQRVMGKTEADVLAAVGRPAKTAADSDASYWHYRHRTTDPVSGTTDADAQVVFRGGRVVDVSY